MKKISSLLLVVLMIISVVVSIYFIKSDGEFNLGLGVYSSYQGAQDATDEANGKGSYVTTAAAVLIDDDGRIIKCKIDTADIVGEFTADGKFINPTELRTKCERREEYGMSAYGKVEWYKQAAAFEQQVIGMRTEEIPSLMTNDGRGSSSVISAGCTIYVTDFIKALDLAVKNATASKANADDTLKLAVITSFKGADATEKDNGKLEFETTVASVTLNNESQISSCVNDCVSTSFAFDINGKAVGEYTGEFKSKLTLKEAYGMSAAGKVEWYKQAAAFNAACVGKTATTVSELMGEDYKGITAVQKAGCTIYVSGMVQVIAKAAK